MALLSLWKIGLPALLFLVAWRLFHGFSQAIEVTTYSEHTMSPLTASLGEILLLGRVGGSPLPENEGRPRARVKQFLSPMEWREGSSQESHSHFEGQREENFIGVQRSPAEVSGVELASAGQNTFTPEGGVLSVSTDLSGSMALSSTEGLPILLPRESNPHYYTQQPDWALPGDSPDSSRWTKLQLGLCIGAAVLAFLGVGAGAYFALSNSHRQEDTTGTSPKEVAEKRVLRLRSNNSG